MATANTKKSTQVVSDNSTVFNVLLSINENESSCEYSYSQDTDYLRVKLYHLYADKPVDILISRDALETMDSYDCVGMLRRMLPEGNEVEQLYNLLNSKGKVNVNGLEVYFGCETEMSRDIKVKKEGEVAKGGQWGVCLEIRPVEKDFRIDSDLWDMLEEDDIHGEEAITMVDDGCIEAIKKASLEMKLEDVVNGDGLKLAKLNGAYAVGKYSMVFENRFYADFNGAPIMKIEVSKQDMKEEEIFAKAQELYESLDEDEQDELKENLMYALNEECVYGNDFNIEEYAFEGDDDYMEEWVDERKAIFDVFRAIIDGEEPTKAALTWSEVVATVMKEFEDVSS